MKNLKRHFIISLFCYTILVFLIRFVAHPLIKDVYHLPDKGATWYYWKLPEANFISGLVVWLCYFMHQFFVWFMFFRIIKDKEKLNVEKNNITMLVGNVLFSLLHIIQTIIFYDGLAQYVPVFSPQISVIIVLILMIFLLAPKRGVFFGKFRNMPNTILQFLKKYHGLYISWALVYTFWFHPTEGVDSLLYGFIYMFLLFIQLNLTRTPLHENLKWLLLLETFVALHGTIVSLNTNTMWPMFLFGFLAMFIITGMHIFNFKIKLLSFITYVIAFLIVYYFRGYNKLYELTYIPVTLYGGFFVLYFLGLIIEKKEG